MDIDDGDSYLYTLAIEPASGSNHIKNLPLFNQRQQELVGHSISPAFGAISFFPWAVTVNPLGGACTHKTAHRTYLL
ncbi:hypothetical protein K5E40_22120 [Pseudomonas baetica]|uniref:hypothetical protein n=1 Tax=Pseudomonas sp. NPDC087615 TaxID=3364443 RepID=UPI0037FE2F2F|nr:hypothetical protein [Pseudomonas baetica]